MEMLRRRAASRGAWRSAPKPEMSWSPLPSPVGRGSQLLGGTARAAALLVASARANEDPICEKLKACQHEVAVEAQKERGGDSPKSKSSSSSLPQAVAEFFHHVEGHGLYAASHDSAQRISALVSCIKPIKCDDGLPEFLNLALLRRLCAEGVPEEVPALRATVWKVLLGYLPANVLRWGESLSRTRALYLQLLREGFRDDTAEAVAADTGVKSPDSTGVGRRAKADVKSILRLVTKDVARTRPELGFFARRLPRQQGEATAEEDEGQQNQGQAGGGQFEVEVAEPRRHSDVLARILLLYARLNPGIGYVQGMNEICAPIYYLFACDPLSDAPAVEADAFFCFSLLMAEMTDAFVEDLNHTQGGMLGRMTHVDEVLQESDPKLWAHLNSQGVTPMLYTARWLSSMLAQDLEMPDVLRVWDALVGDLVGPHPLLHFLCSARVVAIRKELLGRSEVECFQLLKRDGYPAVTVEEMLSVAFTLRSAYSVSPLVEMEQTRSPLPTSRLRSSMKQVRSTSWAGVLHRRPAEGSARGQPMAAEGDQRAFTGQRFLAPPVESGVQACAKGKHMFTGFSSRVGSVARPRRTSRC
mmetsp:Transcript_3058/g.11865  ORF Transcript_3058/g.11865 Transcript_3058/m.11865 type:complete len:586 (+) Transcript_3058:65-1822(+)